MKHVPPQQLIISTEADLIQLRQALRQSARAMELPPAQQARITAAVSEVARALIHHCYASAIVIHCDDRDVHHPLVVECESEREAYQHIARQEPVQTAFSLVDETNVTSSPQGHLVTMKFRTV
ncbi:ATP-binding protein [Chloroflexus sp.]|uniref:ATP-binding protein n=1 Tax=Chloroflexus sp. TaxID=1904827 RepID=UPI00263902EA|nr:hypothetical protein [uncultured Chloroflexus sp.]